MSKQLLKPLYARKELGSKEKYGNGKPKLNTGIYRDKEATRLVYVIPYYYSNHPRKSSKYAMHNCVRFPLEWI